MSGILTGGQAEELHKSIIAYLAANNLTDSVNALRHDLGLGEDVFDASTTKKYELMLEKKWTSTLRLRRKLVDAEAQIAALRAELDSAIPSFLAKRNQDPASWLPSKPARYTLESHQKDINCIAFHPVFSVLASGDELAVIKIWDWELGELERTIKGHTRPVTGLDFGGPKGRVLLASCSSDLMVKLWDPADGYKNVRTLAGHDHSVSAVRFLPSGDRLVSAARDHTVRIWEVATGYCVQTLRGHTDWVRDVCPSDDGSWLLSAGFDRTVRLWNIAGAQPESKVVMTGHENYVDCCAFAPPSSYQLLASMAGLTKPPPATSAVEFMASGSRDKTIKLWDARGVCFKTLVGHDNWISGLVFHPGGRYLLSVSDDKSLRCWDLNQDGRCVKVLEKVHDHFVSCLKWAPPLVKEADGIEPDGKAGNSNNVDVQIRCVIATAGVDMKIKIFAR